MILSVLLGSREDSVLIHLFEGVEGVRGKILEVKVG
jgi:hypothetical protein